MSAPLVTILASRARKGGGGGGRGSEILAIVVVIGILIFLAVRAYLDR
jgi:hypothetical protein